MDERAFREAEDRYWSRLGLTPDERVVSLASGSSLRVQVVGEGPPVLIVHGVNNSGIIVAGIASLLPGFQCFVMDRPGCGLSPPPAVAIEDKEGFFDHVDGLVPQTLEALGLESASIVSTSMGGLFAIRVAALEPDRVTKLVHLGWSMGAPLRKLPLVMRPVNTKLGVSLMARMPVPKLGVKPMLKNIGLRGAFDKGNVPDEFVDAMHALLKHTDTMANEVRTGPLVLNSMEEVVIPREVLSQVKAACLFMWGTDDPLGTPDIARAFTEAIPRATLELLDGAGHAPWFDEPDLVQTRAATFLADAGG